MEISLKRRAYVIAIVDPDFIASLPYIPAGTEKVYYQGFALRSPKFHNLEDVANELATADDPEIVDRLELTPVEVFTADINEAMTYHCDEVNEAAALQLSENPKLIIEDTGEEWVPF